MKIHNISQQNSVLNTFISEIRDTHIQKDSMRFRRNIERIGEILGYEMSKSLNYQSQSINTQLGSSPVSLITNEIVLCSILRAGIPLHQGLLNYFDKAENAFISAYRHHKHNPESFEKREVKIGKTDGTKTEILSGLKPTERIVTRGGILVKLASVSNSLDPHAGHVH